MAFALTLAIESAVEGGSLSLLRGDEEVDSRVGQSGVSRAEELLVDIHDLLESNGVSPRELSLIAASAGPGSFTGLRIGLATALGIARGSGARFASTSSLLACAAAAPHGGIIDVCLPVGRGSAAVQKFASGPAGVSPLSPPQIIAVSGIAGTLGQRDGVVLLHQSLADGADSVGNLKIIGPNLAVAVGRACVTNPTIAEPLFLSKN